MRTRPPRICVRRATAHVTENHYEDGWRVCSPMCASRICIACFRTRWRLDCPRWVIAGRGSIGTGCSSRRRFPTSMPHCRPVAWITSSSSTSSSQASQPAAGAARVHFAHLILPHSPWRFMPSGQQYPGEYSVEGRDRSGVWTTQEWPVLHAHQRHLLQVMYTDRLLGKLLRRLHETGLYDRALIVVVADHGAGFVPGESARKVTAENVADIARVPLIVKLPGQRSPKNRPPTGPNDRHSSDDCRRARRADPLEGSRALAVRSGGCNAIRDRDPQTRRRPGQVVSARGGSCGCRDDQAPGVGLRNGSEPRSSCSARRESSSGFRCEPSPLPG